ncbi:MULTISPECIES: hypothetical protein [Bacillaceae]|uniref:Uncharacterized protein n=1 Tax=Evansella alkalicola TaxID=745819 RepID=A0ABS6JSS3_9BACI|nr:MULTISPECIES: hypothetical protein [Bacillaceae]MBU9721611.1 hypothetical protein [Bacillus alkalicola]
MSHRIIENYLNAKYEEICLDIMNTSTSDYSIDNQYGIKFSSYFDELVFTVLYEPERYKVTVERTYRIIEDKFMNMERSELDFLYLKCENYNSNISDELTYSPSTLHYLANEVMKLINEKVSEHISSLSSDILKYYLEELQNNIEGFAFYGSLEGDDYNTRNYWEEFCYQVQYGDSYPYEITVDVVESHIDSMLCSIPKRDLYLLYTSTDQFIYDEYEPEDYFPFPSEEEMIEPTANKLMEEIKSVATNTYVPDFSSGEDWEDYDEEYEDEWILQSLSKEPIIPEIKELLQLQEYVLQNEGEKIKIPDGFILGGTFTQVAFPADVSVSYLAKGPAGPDRESWDLNKKIEYFEEVILNKINEIEPEYFRDAFEEQLEITFGWVIEEYDELDPEEKVFTCTQILFDLFLGGEIVFKI